MSLASGGIIVNTFSLASPDIMHGRSRGAQQNVKKDGMKQKQGAKLVCVRACAWPVATIWPKPISTLMKARGLYAASRWREVVNWWWRMRRCVVRLHAANSPFARQDKAGCPRRSHIAPPRRNQGLTRWPPRCPARCILQTGSELKPLSATSHTRYESTEWCVFSMVSAARPIMSR